MQVLVRWCASHQLGLHPTPLLQAVMRHIRACLRWGNTAAGASLSGHPAAAWQCADASTCMRDSHAHQLPDTVYEAGIHLTVPALWLKLASGKGQG